MRQGLCLLISQQHINFPIILKELKENKRKIGHWSWWVFPTQKEGYNEPSFNNLKTSVKKSEINILLEKTNLKLYIQIFNELSLLLKNYEDVIPDEDHQRIKHFLKLFDNNISNKYKKFKRSFQQFKNLFNLTYY